MLSKWNNLFLIGIMLVGYLNYNDKVMIGNFIKQANDDISQTNRKIAAGTHYEGNPLVAPFSEDPTLMRAGGLVGQGLLTHRWANMESDQQRFLEILLANLVEAWALNASGEKAHLTFGHQF
jgi:hypothetical protein